MHKLLKLIASRHIWRQLKDSFQEKKCFSIEWQFKLPIGEKVLKQVGGPSVWILKSMIYRL